MGLVDKRASILLFFLNCALCIGKGYEKRIGITIWVDEYERNNKRVRSKHGRYMKSKRQSTVEPAWGTLTQFMGLCLFQPKSIPVVQSKSIPF